MAEVLQLIKKWNCLPAIMYIFQGEKIINARANTYLASQGPREGCQAV